METYARIVVKGIGNVDKIHGNRYHKSVIAFDFGDCQHRTVTEHGCCSPDHYERESLKVIYAVLTAKCEKQKRFKGRKALLSVLSMYPCVEDVYWKFEKDLYSAGFVVHIESTVYVSWREYCR